MKKIFFLSFLFIGMMTKAQNVNTLSASYSGNSLTVVGNAFPGTGVFNNLWFDLATNSNFGGTVNSSDSVYSGILEPDTFVYTYNNVIPDTVWVRFRGLYTNGGLSFVYGDTLKVIRSHQTTVVDTTAPAPPTALDTTSVDTNRVMLRWTLSTSSDVDSQKLYRDGLLRATLAKNVTSYTDLNLQTASHHCYFLQAVDTAGNSSDSSNVYCVTTDSSVVAQQTNAPDTIAPNAPTALDTLFVDSVKIKIHWTPSTSNDVAVQKVYRGITQIAVLNASTSSYVDSVGLQPAHSYCYFIGAVDTATNESFSATKCWVTDSSAHAVQQTVVDTTKPNAQTNLDTVFVDSTRLRLFWSLSTSSDVQQQILWKSGTPIVLGPNVTSYVDSVGVQPAHQYCYFLVAVDTANNYSNNSNSICVMTDSSVHAQQQIVGDTIPPSAPSGLDTVSGSVTQTSAFLFWSPSSDNSGIAPKYQVWRDTTYITTTTGTNYFATSLIQNTLYAWKVRSIDTSNNVSAFSNVLTFRTDAAPFVDTIPPSTPTNLSVFGITPTGATANWNASTDNVGIRHYRIKVNTVVVDSTANLAYVVSGLIPQTTNTVSIAAVDSSWLVSNYISVTFQTPAPQTFDTIPPSKPTMLDTMAGTVTQTSAFITWNASTDNIAVAAYKVWRNDTLVTTTSNTYYNPANLIAGTLYRWKVKAQDISNNLSGFSDSLVFRTDYPPYVDTYAPAPITNLLISNLQPISATASWTASDSADVVKYLIKLNSVLIDSTSSTSYGLTGLTPVNNYTISIAGKDANGNLSTWVSTSFVTPQVAFVDVTPPTAPTQLTASGTTHTTTTLNWHFSTDSVGVAGYNVYKNSQFLTSVIGTSAFINNLTAGVSTDFYVTAFDAAGNESDPSNVISVITPGYDVLPPTMVTGLDTPNVTSTTVQLTWNVSTDNSGTVLGYRVKQDGVEVTTTPVPGCTITGLTENMQYTFTVEAYDTSFNYSQPASIDVITDNSIVPVPNPAPVLISLSTNMVPAGTGTILITVNVDQAVPGCKLSFNLDTNSIVTTYLSTTQVQAIVSASLLTQANQYDVRLWNPGPGGGFSNILSFTVYSLFPTPFITGVTPNYVAQGSGYVTVSIVGTNFQTNYHQMVYHVGTGDYYSDAVFSSTELDAILPLDVTDYVGDYYIRVGVIQADNSVSWSNALVIHVIHGTTGIAEDTLQQMKVFPNPIKDHATVELGDGDTYTGNMNIYNVAGNIVKQVELKEGKGEIDFSLPAGVYMATVPKHKGSIKLLFIE